ncbi:DUF6351 family protein [Nocardioides piscis]|uniref:DUF6351 family protein n=1 Tax=Nocardioides piscis TaxID=2714938 RepID=UPI00197D0060|nr:DUF6351 family protein [Nocardioides piscis]
MQRHRSVAPSIVLALAASALAVVGPAPGGQALGPATPAAAPTAAIAAPATSARASTRAVRPGPRRTPRLRVQVLSNRADLISGGDALVAIRVPQRVRPRQVKVMAGKRVVTKRFRTRPDGRFVGLVNKLRVGRTTIKATAPGARRGRTVIVNHPAGGPVFTGPQPAHYRCQDTARDAACNEPARYSWLYKSTGSPGLKPYDRANPPSDVATTTTDQGVEVPFIVRREDGYSDRDRYAILTLFRPGKGWKAWRPQEQWNHKLLITHGGGCGASYTPGTPRLDDFSGTLPEGSPVENSYVAALGRGFAVASTALSNTGHNCNLAVNAESLMMTKERLVERYGALRYTIGTGCSGGSIAQHTLANSYPGIYQGLVTSCSYPDVLTAGAQFADYHLMRRYFEQPQRWAPGVVWSPTQVADVEGHVTPVNAVAADEGLFKEAINPEHACDGTATPVAGDRSTRFDSEINPGGVRCSILDISVNLLGRRPASAWSPQEQAAGHGFAGIPFANSGVQYGLEALRAGRITPAQFVDLNAKLGGLDVNADPVAQRIPGDAGAITSAYRTGMVNNFTHTDEVAIINHGGPDPGAAHDYAHAVWTELRMQRSQGHTDNRVTWFGPTPLIGDASWAIEGLIAMDKWLSAVEKDRRRVPLAQKIVEDRPAGVADRCVGVCDGGVLQTNLSTPRQAAGGPAANDVLACQRVPIDRSAYKTLGLPVLFTEAEWATLQRVFPDGVCDWSQPGRGQAPTQTWLKYGDATTPRFGGVNLPRAPKRSGRDWFGPVFQEFWRK